MHSTLGRFTHHLTQVLSYASRLSMQEERSKVEPIHLFVALAAHPSSLIKTFFPPGSFTLSPDILLAQSPSSTTLLPSFSAASKKILVNAVILAGSHHHRYVGTEHLLASLLESRSKPLRALLAQEGIHVPTLKRQISSLLQGSTKITELVDSFVSSPQQTQTSSRSRSITALDYFATHLTDEARSQALDPLVGRTRELERVIHILARRTKHNPLLLGEAGVGKTALIEGLAARIASGDVPHTLLGRRVYTLDLAALVAGTSYRGELEARVVQILDELRANKDIILFIDEIHLLVGSGSGGGTMDIANIFKPALARGELRCVGATTFNEYKQHIEPDAALSRRFQCVSVSEPSRDEARHILAGLTPLYEQYHSVIIPPDVIDSAVDLSMRYLPERRLPDKAIDLLDEACARVSVQSSDTSPLSKVRVLERRLNSLEQRADRAVFTGNDLAEALKMKKDLISLRKDMAETRKQSEQLSSRPTSSVAVDDVVACLSLQTGIPSEHILSSEYETLLTLEARLNDRVLGQPLACEAVARRILRSKAGIGSDSRPLGSFLFLGPTGVGKTEMARVLADEVCGPDSLIKLDMSEFAESHTASRLIGSPSGYVGYKEGGTLTEAVRRKPYSVVLFDEIEKAHPRLSSLLLQILEDGYLVDAAGLKVDFSNTIIVLTSNIGADAFSKRGSLGFTEGTTRGQAEELVRSELKSFFSPELLGRFDGVLCFSPLDTDTLRTITRRLHGILSTRLSKKNIRVTMTSRALSHFIDTCSHEGGSGRAVRRHFEHTIEHLVSEALIARGVGKPYTITIDARKGELVSRVKHT